MPNGHRFCVYVFSTAILTITFADAARAQGRPPTPVRVTQVVVREVPPSLRLVGTIRPDKSAVVAAEISGMVASFEADEGQFLGEGAVICRLNAAVARLRLQEAEANLAGLREQFEELERGERPEEIARLEAVVAEAEALLSKWEFERRRIASLYDSGQSSDKEKHDTEMEYLAATRRLAQARAELEMAQNGPRTEVIARARQAVLAQEAVAQRLRRDLEKTEIRAPFDGAIVMKRTEIGEWIEEGGAVCELIALDTVRIRVDVPEGAIPFARPGAPATIEVEALERRQSGKITRVIPLAIQAARTFPVEVDLPNEDHTLLPGMFVWAYVPSGPVGNRLMVTKDAIVAQGLAKQVFVIRPAAPGQPEMAIPTPVTTGLELEDQIEVQAEGLQAGDRVVTRANERLFGPTPVVATPMDAAAAPTTRPVETAKPDGAPGARAS